jgi:hypothetical protein
MHGSGSQWSPSNSGERPSTASKARPTSSGRCVHCTADARAPHICAPSPSVRDQAQRRSTMARAPNFVPPPCVAAARPILPFDVMRVLDNTPPSIYSTCGQRGTVGVVEPQYWHDCTRKRYHGSERGIRFDGVACCSALGANLLEMNLPLEQIESPPVSGMGRSLSAGVRHS